MRRLVYLSSARRDLLSILRHIAKESGNVKIADAFVSKLERQCEKLASLPGTLGRARSELGRDLRSFPRGSYVIFFRYTDGRLEVVNILQGHQDLDAYFSESDA